jgi:hypothetical protein
VGNLMAPYPSADISSPFFSIFRYCILTPY